MGLPGMSLSNAHRTDVRSRLDFRAAWAMQRYPIRPVLHEPCSATRSDASRGGIAVHSLFAIWLSLIGSSLFLKGRALSDLIFNHSLRWRHGDTEEACLSSEMRLVLQFQVYHSSVSRCLRGKTLWSGTSSRDSSQA